MQKKGQALQRGLGSFSAYRALILPDSLIMSDDPIKNDPRDDSKDFMPDKDNWDFQSMPNPASETEDSMLANTSTIKDDTSRDINA